PDPEQLPPERRPAPRQFRCVLADRARLTAGAVGCPAGGLPRWRRAGPCGGMGRHDARVRSGALQGWALEAERVVGGRGGPERRGALVHARPALEVGDRLGLLLLGEPGDEAAAVVHAGGDVDGRVAAAGPEAERLGAPRVVLPSTNIIWLAFPRTQRSMSRMARPLSNRIGMSRGT